MVTRQHPTAVATTPERQIRAHYDTESITVYQAYRKEIALAALEAQHFVEPFSLNRVTWIKPSFYWMMYRAGWGEKEGQEYILGIRVKREMLDQALGKVHLTSFNEKIHGTCETWERQRASEVLVQWDPERNWRIEKMPYRSLQVGLKGSEVKAYAQDWILSIEDVTSLARRAKEARFDKELPRFAPEELPYPLSAELRARLGITEVGQ